MDKHSRVTRPLAVQSGIGIGGRGARLSAALLTVKVPLGIAARRRRLAAAVLRAKALLVGRLNIRNQYTSLHSLLISLSGWSATMVTRTIVRWRKRFARALSDGIFWVVFSAASQIARGFFALSLDGPPDEAIVPEAGPNTGSGSIADCSS